MRARYHVIVSAGVSLGVQAYFNSWPATTTCFLSGILIDLDHFLDYYIEKKTIPFRYKDLVDFCIDFKGKKVFLLLHSYELLIMLWLLIYLLHLDLAWIGFAIGVTIHMAFDQFTNPIKPLFYFLTYRILNHFKSSKLLLK